MEPRNLTFEDIRAGDSAEFKRSWSEEDIDLFAKLSGNYNPLHTDDSFAQDKGFSSKLIYGMHVAVVCSTFVGMYMPGLRCLCLRQLLDFKKPIYVGDTTVITGRVERKIESTRMLEIALSVTKDGEEVVSGTMLVQVLS